MYTSVYERERERQRQRETEKERERVGGRVLATCGCVDMYMCENVPVSHMSSPDAECPAAHQEFLQVQVHVQLCG